MGQIEVKCCKSQLRHGDDGLTPAEEAELERQKHAESLEVEAGPDYGQLPSTLRASEDDAEDLGREWEKKKQAAVARKAQDAIAGTEKRPSSDVQDEQLNQDEKFAEAQRRKIARAEVTRQHEKAEEEHKIALEKTRLARERLKAAEEEAKRKQETRQAEAAARQKVEADRAAAAPQSHEVESDEEVEKNPNPRETRRLSAKDRLAAAKAKAQAAAASKRKELEASM